MGRQTVNLASTIEEIIDDSDQMANLVAARKVAEKKRAATIAPVAKKSPPESSPVKEDPSETKIAKSSEHDPTEKQSRTVKSRLAPKSEIATAPDPWVTASVKMRHSKHRRLQKLSKQRDIEDLSPCQMKDLVDEALDYIFERYSPKS